MPKGRKRAQPITGNGRNNATVSSTKTRRTIRKFHRLIKQLPTTRDGAVVAEIEQEIEHLGGLAAYQNMSAIGQSSDRGGGSEQVLIKWLQDLVDQDRKHSLLEVGALKPDNYKRYHWLDVTPIDLNSRHPNIVEQDFLAMDLSQHGSRWDIISLSLVINFVPDANDRGRMLQLAHDMLISNGYLFLVLPLPCVCNSRYLTEDHLIGLLRCIGFSLVQGRWKQGRKMAYWLFRKDLEGSNQDKTMFQRKVIMRTGNRNNFFIRLP